MARNAERNLEWTVEDLTGRLRDSLELREQLGLLDDVYSKLLDRYQNLGIYPADDDHDRHLGVLYALVASIHRRHGEMKEARADLQECLTIRKRLCEKNPKDPNYKSELAAVLDSLADVDMDEGHPENAKASLLESAKYRYELQKDSNDPDRLVAYATTQMRLSDVLRGLGQSDQAQTEFQTALDLLKQRETDVDAKYAEKLGVALLVKGDKSRNDGDVVSARESYRESCDAWKDLCQREPANVSYQVSYAVALLCLGDAQREMGEHESEEQSYLLGCEIRKRLFEDSQGDVFRAAEYAVSLTTLGDLYQSKDDWKNAWEDYDRALQIRKELAAKAPGDLNRKSELAVSYTNEGDVLLAQGEPDKALDQYKEALKNREILTGSDPKNLWRQDGLAGCYLSLGDAYMAKRSCEDAELYYGKSANLRDRLKKNDPTNPVRDVYLAVSNAKVAIAKMALGGKLLADKAEADWNSALPKLQSRLDKDAENVAFAQSVAGFCLQFGQESLKQQRRITAQKAFDLGEKLLADKDKEGRLDFYGARVLKQLRERKQALAATPASGS